MKSNLESTREVRCEHQRFLREEKSSQHFDLFLEEIALDRG
jgi:hypothetical protein